MKRHQDAHPMDQHRSCCFCGSTRSVKVYTRDGSDVECRDARGCIERQSK